MNQSHPVDLSDQRNQVHQLLLKYKTFFFSFHFMITIVHTDQLLLLHLVDCNPHQYQVHPHHLMNKNNNTSEYFLNQSN